MYALTLAMAWEPVSGMATVLARPGAAVRYTDVADGRSLPAHVVLAGCSVGRNPEVPRRLPSWAAMLPPAAREALRDLPPPPRRPPDRDLRPWMPLLADPPGEPGDGVRVVIRGASEGDRPGSAWLVWRSGDPGLPPESLHPGACVYLDAEGTIARFVRHLRGAAAAGVISVVMFLILRAVESGEEEVRREREERRARFRRGSSR